MTIIKGYGAINEYDLDKKIEDVIADVKSFDIEPGKFIRKYGLNKSGGGNILTMGANLEGAMYEFDKAFMVVWSCGEYIDCAVIEKD